MAFSSHADMDMIQIAASLFAVQEMKLLDHPAVLVFNVLEGRTLDVDMLLAAIMAGQLPLSRCPERDLLSQRGETKKALQARRKHVHQASVQEAAEKLLDHLWRQWPCQELAWPPLSLEKDVSVYLDLDTSMASAQSKFQTWLQNQALDKYLRDIEAIISKQPVRQVPVAIPDPCTPDEPPGRRKACTKLDDVFSPATAPATEPPPRPRLPIQTMPSLSPPSNGRPCLESVVRRLESRTGSSYEKQYAKELGDSLSSLQSQRGKSSSNSRVVSIADGHGDLDDISIQALLDVHIAQASQHTRALSGAISEAVLSNLTWSDSLALGLHHGPRLSSPIVLLQQLHYKRWNRLPEGWKKWVVAYGLALAEVQRAQRLVQVLSHGGGDLLRELQNEGHTNWDPMEKPEALLLEIDGDILIREVQEDIAQQMSNPPGMQNAVMQLNMGEGKSSVIVPLVAVAAADGTRLARVVVAKPQSRQMFHMLVAKLGGLLSRRIFHLPFSRVLRLKKNHVLDIYERCQDCIKTHGILLAQPEHLLSFKLMGVETQLSGQEAISSLLLRTQHLFDVQSRDIVDESDENFSVKFELIYTIGAPCPIEFCPDRWIVIQTVLDFVQRHTAAVQEKLPLSIEIHKSPGENAGGFPRLRLLEQNAVDLLLLELVARDICETGFPGCPVARQSASCREAVRKYITQAPLSASDIASVEQSSFWTEATKSHLLLLRGLFAEGVLAFVFAQKRWRVNYGLDRSRKPPTRLAVPFRAKDQPTARSEYSHPDVIIVLTCTCYYYQGLDDDDLFVTFRSLIDADQADAEYQGWVNATPGLPAAFRQLMGINLEDTVQCQKDLFPFFRYTKPVIDYFLRTIVFPKQMREFPKKLSASGWDLAGVKPHPTTGFSGTIDARRVLPLDMTHLDLPEQKHTNALVLEYLLQPENSVILLPPSDCTADCDAPDTSGIYEDVMVVSPSVADDLLKLVMRQSDDQLRVILDVGAQVLELTNRQMAEKWLALEHTRHADVEAVIYFDDSEEIVVLDYRGNTEPLRISPYEDQLDLCLVFLDEAHTRGTDLRLPETYKAAVTLGAKLTKDRLVQACMRMRKLGNGQSVLFCVPQEIQTQILEARRQDETRANAADITVADVLVWAVGETHKDLRLSMPLWAVQGRRYENQRAVWEQAVGSNNRTILLTMEQARALLEDEGTTLDQRYRPTPLTAVADDDPMFVDDMADIKRDEEGAADRTGEATTTTESRLQAISNRCAEVSRRATSSGDQAALSEEQEREMAPEIEEERQTERPRAAKAADRYLHPDLEAFVRSGRLVLDATSGEPVSRAFLPAFRALRKTTAAQHLDVGMFPPDILVTKDFVKTINVPKGGSTAAGAAGRPKNDDQDGALDAYQRPVQWILSSQPASWDRVVVISPFEAHALLPRIRMSQAATLHLYAARPNLEIPPLDHLSLYTVPPRPEMPLPPLRLAVLLNLFAGQLHMQAYDEYVALCNILRLSWSAATDDVEIAADGYIVSSSASPGEDGDHSGAALAMRQSRFTQSPVAFLNVFLSKIRRDGQPIDRTHLGTILGGALLQKKDFAKEHWAE